MDLEYSFLNDLVKRFYRIQFDDPMLAHFFMNHSLEKIAEKQTQYLLLVLAGKQPQSSPIEPHRHLHIRRPHLMRRRKILAEFLEAEDLPPNLKAKWLRIEDQIGSRILERGASPCRSLPKA